VRPGELCGIWRKPYLDLAPLFDLTCLPEVDEEISPGLTRVAPSYTGGSLKWMGVVAPPVMKDGYLDLMEVIESLPSREIGRAVLRPRLERSRAPAPGHGPWLEGRD
jgi:Rieske 2Fe-2S family protein